MTDSAHEFLIRKLVRRCMEHSDIMVDPIGVLANERDRMLDELEQPWVEKVKEPPVKAETNGATRNGRKR